MYAFIITINNSVIRSRLENITFIIYCTERIIFVSVFRSRFSNIICTVESRRIESASGSKIIPVGCDYTYYMLSTMSSYIYYFTE